ncbi:STAS domain-containing protein [Streptomyces sp. NPDC048256]|uniref:STAS domain-containing protein n=1 Tax=Streptomyces sp. NPDC048256 TaxID=3154613 RepID=UPI0033E64533
MADTGQSRAAGSAVSCLHRHRRHPRADPGRGDRPDTGQALRQALDASGAPRPRIVVDLSRVTFMDSIGINIFVAAHCTLTEADGWIRLAAPGSRDAHPADRRRRRSDRLP